MNTWQLSNEIKEFFLLLIESLKYTPAQPGPSTNKYIQEDITPACPPDMNVLPIHARNGRLITSTSWDNLPTPLAPSMIITYLALLHSLWHSKMKNLRRFQHWRGTWPYQEPLAIPRISLGYSSLGKILGSSSSKLTSCHSKHWIPLHFLEVNPRWRFGENESFLSRIF